MLNYFRPKPGRFGVAPTILSSANATVLASNATATITLGGYSKRALINGFTVAFPDLAVVSTSATLTFQKYDKSAAAAVELTTGVSILTPTAVIRTAQVIKPIATLTDAQLLLDIGDTVEAKIVTVGTASSSPTYMVFTVELLVQE